MFADPNFLMWLEGKNITQEWLSLQPLGFVETLYFYYIGMVIVGQHDISFKVYNKTTDAPSHKLKGPITNDEIATFAKNLRDIKKIDELFNK